ncbi:MAG TPA: NB-ARC domain-containing protein [Streptosporangiaceae bacterium]|nr:NB-ARC domain-containing protein [Streptosporangiaceae bacterium]
MRRRKVSLGLLAGLLALLAALIAIPLTVVSGYLPGSVTQHRLLWIVLLAVSALAIFALAWMSAWAGGRAPAAARWQVLPPPAGYVDRAELAQTVSALTASGGVPVALTTGLVGAGGFGKTTLAARACHDRAVRRRFRAGVWVTVGRDLDEAGLAAKISGVVRGLGGEAAAFADVEQAGRALAGALRELPGPVLIVADDVWNQAQLAPFLAAGQAGRLLVTTRRPGALDGTGVRLVKVDQVSGAVAEALLTRGLPPLGGERIRELLGLAGGWPLLLGLINRRLREDVARGAAARVAAADVAARLRRDGPAAIDISDSGSRATAAAATIGYSLELAGEAGRDRFVELGIFAEDADVPVADAAMLWQATAGLGEAEAVELCERLDGLSLLSLAWDRQSRTITQHDVIRDFARARLGPERVAELNGVLVAAAASPLSAAGPLAAGAASPGARWWEPGALSGYLRSHLIWHLHQADRPGTAEAVACDLRWAGSRLEGGGPVAVAADLAEAGTARAGRMLAAVTRAANLLAPAEPSGAVVDVFHSRLAADPNWGPQVAALRDGYARPRLVSRWPLPDLPDPARLARLDGHQGRVRSVCPVTVNGRDLLASGGGDGTVRIWDPATGQMALTLEGRQGQVLSLCPVTVNGRELLASGDDDGTVRIWDPATGEPVVTLHGHHGWVLSMCPVTVAGRDLLASGGYFGTVRIWDPATGEPVATLHGHKGGVRAVCPVTVNGRELLASGDDDGTMRIWDTATGEPVATLEGHQGRVNSVCPVSVGGRDLLASGGDDGTVRIWDPATGKQARLLESRQRQVLSVCPVTVGGRDLLASGGHDATVRIWDPATGEPVATLHGHQDWVRSMCPAIVNGRHLLASASDDRTVLIWDPATGEPVATPHGHPGPVRSVCPVTVGGRDLLASGGGDGTVRMWDPATSKQARTLEGHRDPVSSVCPVSVGGRHLLASGGDDGTVRIWDPATGQMALTLEGRQGQVLSLCPVMVGDRHLLASGGIDGAVGVWDPATGEPVSTLPGYQGGVRAVCPVRVAGRDLLASGSGDGTVRIWDPATGEPVVTLEGHQGWVNAVCPVRVAGRDLLASGGDDGTVRIWDPATAQIRALMRVEGPLRSYAQIGPTGLAAGGDGGLYLFDYLPGVTEPVREPETKTDSEPAA